jgi:uncharacterized protein YegJ (DUF2314 family)
MPQLLGSGKRLMIRWTTFMAVVVLTLAGCGTKAPTDGVIHVADDDPGMNAAIAKARATVDAFITALQSPRPNQTEFSVKMAFTDRGKTEHMWLSPVTYDGTKFQGIVNNDPEMVKNVKIGQEVTVAPGEISDWMYVENEKLVGGETLRVLRNALSPAERAAFDESVPFVIE